MINQTLNHKLKIQPQNTNLQHAMMITGRHYATHTLFVSGAPRPIATTNVNTQQTTQTSANNLTNCTSTKYSNLNLNQKSKSRTSAP